LTHTDLVRLLLAFSLWAVALGRPGGDLQRYESVEPHLGTLVRVVVYTPGEEAARDAFRAAFERIRDLDRLLSDYREDSELNQVTRSAPGRAVRVSDDLFAVLATADDLARATDGAFDITQGPVVRLWREARRTSRAPDPAALREARERSGFRRMRLDAATRTVTFDAPAMALDVGALGKGYAASEAIRVLGKLGVRSALVAASGDLAFGDAPPGQRGWRIGIDSGEGALAPVPAVLELTNAAVSTAGGREQYVEIDGRRYSHIVDPASGMGLTDDLTVTVVAPHGLEADALDTAISVLGARRGLELIESRPATAALIVQRTKSGTRALPSSRFAALAKTTNTR
jgi:thiamine biosynthesis lipoprotein